MGPPVSGASTVREGFGACGTSGQCCDCMWLDAVGQGLGWRLILKLGGLRLTQADAQALLCTVNHFASVELFLASEKQIEVFRSAAQVLEQSGFLCLRWSTWVHLVCPTLRRLWALGKKPPGF